MAEFKQELDRIEEDQKELRAKIMSLEQRIAKLDTKSVTKVSKTCVL